MDGARALAGGVSSCDSALHVDAGIPAGCRKPRSHLSSLFLHGVPQWFCLIAGFGGAAQAFRILTDTSMVRVRRHELSVIRGYPIRWSEQKLSHPVLSVTCDKVESGESYTLWAERGGVRVKILRSTGQALPSIELGEWLAMRLDVALNLPQELEHHRSTH